MSRLPGGPKGNRVLLHPVEWVWHPLGAEVTLAVWARVGASVWFREEDGRKVVASPGGGDQVDQEGLDVTHASPSVGFAFA